MTCRTKFVYFFANERKKGVRCSAVAPQKSRHKKRKNSAGTYEKHSSEFFLEVRSRVELLYTVLQTAT